MGSNSVARVWALILSSFSVSKSGGRALPAEAFISKHLKRCLGTILISDSSPGPVKSPPLASWIALIRSWRLWLKQTANSKREGNFWRPSCLCSWNLQREVLLAVEREGLCLHQGHREEVRITYWGQVFREIAILAEGKNGCTKLDNTLVLLKASFSVAGYFFVSF